MQLRTIRQKCRFYTNLGHIVTMPYIRILDEIFCCKNFIIMIINNKNSKLIN